MDTKTGIDHRFWADFTARNGWAATVALLRKGLDAGALTPQQVDDILQSVRGGRLAA